MISKELVNEFIEKIKDDYSYNAKIRNGKYSDLDIYTKDGTWLVALVFGKENNATELIHTTFNSNQIGLSYLHDCIDLLMLVNEMLHQQKEIDEAKIKEKHVKSRC